MAMISCGECGRPVSDKASACPECGNPIATAARGGQAVGVASPPAAPAAAPAAAQAKANARPTSIASVVVLVALLGVGYWVYRAQTNDHAAPLSAGLGGLVRQPTNVVNESVKLKEGEAMMYSFTTTTDAKVEVTVSARPEKIDVMLMTDSDVAAFKKAQGSLFGGKYKYRQALSRQGVMSMKQNEVLPAGKWTIVVQRPAEALLMGKATVAEVLVTVY
jgi:hypothetical protein